MNDLLEIYNGNNAMIAVKDRDVYYREAEEEFQRTGKVSTKVKSVRLLLMNSGGRIYVQKRSSRKEQNPDLYDKTIGGHVISGHTANITLVQECAQELGFPAVPLDEEEFLQAVRSTDLRIIGLFRKVGFDPDFPSVRRTASGSFTSRFMTTFYVGYYDGAIRFADGEASGVEVFSLEELQADVLKKPEKFTEDLKTMLKQFAPLLVPLSALPPVVPAM